MAAPSRALALAVALALAAVTAGCGSSPRPADSTAPSTTASSSSRSVPSSSEPPRSEEPTPTTSAPPTVEPTASTVEPAGDACPAAALAIAALPGSGSSGTQYELVQFTNTGTAACSLTGFPAVSLRLAGEVLGTAATPSATAPAAVRLDPGGVATALLSGPSTCDAPLSDTLRVTAPGATGYTDVAGAVRGCPLTVDPVAAA